MGIRRYAAGLVAALAAGVFGGCSSSAPLAVATTDPTIPTTSSATAAAGPTHTPTALPPFVDRVQWVGASGGRSLRVYPTAAGRVAQGTTDAQEAWSEVLRLAPDADQPGMRAQFDCHWTYARLVAPDKPSWNLEPWRPVVSLQQMVDARCNPGGPESLET